MGKEMPSAARSFFSSSVRYSVAAFLSEEVEGGEGLWEDDWGLAAETSEDTDPLMPEE